VAATQATATVKAARLGIRGASTKSGTVGLPPEGGGGSGEGFAVEFDDVAVGVEDVDLRMAGDGVWAELEAEEVVGGEVVAKALGAEPRESLLIAGDAEGEVNVPGIVGLVAAHHRLGAEDDVDVAAVTDLKPDARKRERGTRDLLELEDVAIEAAGALDVVNGDENVMEIELVRFGHDV